METHLQTRQFKLYQFARLLVILGAEAQALAVSWQVYQITRSTLSLGYTGLFLFLPGLLFVLLAGHAADRYRQKSLIMWSYTGQAVFSIALLWISLQHLRTAVPIYATLFCIGAARCFSGPASSTLLPMLVPEAKLVKAVTSGATIYQLGNMLGPVIGGLLFTVSLPAFTCWRGAPVIYGFTLLTVLLFLAVVRSLRVDVGAHRRSQVQSSDLLTGFHFVFRNKLLFGTILLDTLAMFFGGAVALMPVCAVEKLHLGAAGLGFLRAVPGVGAVGASAMLFVAPKKRLNITGMLISMAIFGSATVIFGLSRSLPVSVGSLLIIGASGMLSLVGRASAIQLSTPLNIRGRVSAISWLVSGASNEFGQFESGLTAHWFGAARAVIMGGAASLIITGVFFLKFRDLHQEDSVNRLEGPSIVPLRTDRHMQSAPD